MVDNAALTDDGDRSGHDTREFNENHSFAVNEKKKKKRRKSKQAELWTSAEYKLVASDPNAPGFRPPHYKPPTVCAELNYRSSEYGTETKKPSRHPWVPLKDAYLSEEYKKQYPLPLISIPGCPPGHTPQEGPWVQFVTSMWGTIWELTGGQGLTSINSAFKSGSQKIRLESEVEKNRTRRKHG
ncbi:hypothetical protein R1sor_006996 [Riccia sorocarpa]|uniref:Uncharacterized protein n=1 Tax=Riccia sorocarpa TaxID=122646 RepID=A0ABD3HP55_9MARC